MVSLYMDENVHGSIVRELRRKGVDLVIAFEDGMGETADRLVLMRATALGKVMFSQDTDMLEEAIKCMETNIYFTGAIFAPQSLGIGPCVKVLYEFAAFFDLPDFENEIVYLKNYL